MFDEAVLESIQITSEERVWFVLIYVFLRICYATLSSLNIGLASVIGFKNIVKNSTLSIILG